MSRRFTFSPSPAHHHTVYRRTFQSKILDGSVMSRESRSHRPPLARLIREDPRPSRRPWPPSPTANTAFPNIVTDHALHKTPRLVAFTSVRPFGLIRLCQRCGGWPATFSTLSLTRPQAPCCDATRKLEGIQTAPTGRNQCEGYLLVPWGASGDPGTMRKFITNHAFGAKLPRATQEGEVRRHSLADAGFVHPFR